MFRRTEVDAYRTGSPASEGNEGRKAQRLYEAYHLGSVATPYHAGPAITCRPSLDTLGLPSLVTPARGALAMYAAYELGSVATR